MWKANSQVAHSLLLGVIFFITPCHAAEPLADPPAVALKVITFNVQFLPKIVRKMNKRPDVEYRAETLGTLLREYDVVALNEMFDAEPRDKLLATLKAGYGEPFHQILPPEKSESGLGIGSGLAAVCRLAVVEQNYLRYPSRGGRLRNIIMADGAAAKGAVHVRLRRDGFANPPAEADIFITHLESRDATVRIQQLRALSDFMEKHHDAERSCLILGDLNTPADIPRDDQPPLVGQSTPYQEMLSILGDKLPDHTLQDVWLKHGKGPGGTAEPDEDSGGNRIDYILLADPKGVAPRLVATSIRVNRFADQRVGTLSDHAAVEAEFQWRSP